MRRRREPARHLADDLDPDALPDDLDPDTVAHEDARGVDHGHAGEPQPEPRPDADLVESLSGNLERCGPQPHRSSPTQTEPESPSPTAQPTTSPPETSSTTVPSLTTTVPTVPIESSSTPLWPWLLVALVVIGAIAFYVIRRRSLGRRGGAEPPEDHPEGPNAPPTT